MSELVLELSLKRSSGVLAGIVAALAQAGVHLQTQKLDRSGTGWLTIHAEGDSPDPAALSERLNGTRGVDRLVRLIIDGETVIEDGASVAAAEAEAEPDPIRSEDLAELSAGATRKSAPDEADATRALDEVPSVIDDTEAAYATQDRAASPVEELPTDETPLAESPAGPGSQTEALDREAAMPVSEQPSEPELPPHAAEFAHAEKASGERSAGAGGQQGDATDAPLNDEERVKLNLRRRRRRRR